ncbi:MAG: hypothetical protein IPG02_17585 [Ignavibacteria bacterium]|nr:hypothetical protein [Ignavibacteria bacterium]
MNVLISVYSPGKGLTAKDFQESKQKNCWKQSESISAEHFLRTDILFFFTLLT